MSGEPKTLTLKELLNLAREHEWSVHFQEGGCVEVEGIAGEDLAYARGLHAALSDAATTVLGVPVVARDETAELRAEVMRLRKSRTELDCRFTLGNVADFGGSHCPFDEPCERCRADRARDDATELRAAIREWGDAEREYIAELAISRRAPTTFKRLDATQARWLAALKNLRRLAGGESRSAL